MPSSGARSGTQPSRSQRGAGDGKPSGTLLKCGHSTDDEAVVVYPGGKKLFRCPDGCGLQKKK